MEQNRTRHSTEAGGFISAGAACKGVTQPAWNKLLAGKAKALQSKVPNSGRCSGCAKLWNAELWLPRWIFAEKKKNLVSASALP